MTVNKINQLLIFLESLKKQTQEIEKWQWSLQGVCEEYCLNV